MPRKTLTTTAAVMCTLGATSTTVGDKTSAEAPAVSAASVPRSFPEYRWTGSAGNLLWSDAGNWNPDVPGPGDAAVFESSASVTIDPSIVELGAILLRGSASDPVLDCGSHTILLDLLDVGGDNQAGMDIFGTPSAMVISQEARVSQYLGLIGCSLVTTSLTLSAHPAGHSFGGKVLCLTGRIECDELVLPPGTLLRMQGSGGLGTSGVLEIASTAVVGGDLEILYGASVVASVPSLDVLVETTLSGRLYSDGEFLIDGSVLNLGNFGVGGLGGSVAGDFRQFNESNPADLRSGTLQHVVGTTGDHGPLVVGGTAYLRGGCAVDLDVGDGFLVLVAAEIAGRFDVAYLPQSPDPTEFFSLAYTPASRSVGRAVATVSLVANPLGVDVDLDPAPTEDIGAAGVPTDAVLGDIDSDDDPDLVVVLQDSLNPTTAPGSVVILYNADDGNPANGWEGFSGGTLQVSVGVGVNPSSVALGLIDADSIPDIVVANRGTPGNTANDTLTVVLVGNGTATSFSVSDTRSILVGDEPRDVAIGELDGDGTPDILVANSRSDSITVAFGSGIGVGPSWLGVEELDEVDLPIEDDVPVSVRPGDTNAGLFGFFACANQSSSTVTSFRAKPDRTFALLGSIPTGDGPVELVIANLNSDASNPNDWPELVTINRSPNPCTSDPPFQNASVSFAIGSDGPDGIAHNSMHSFEVVCDASGLVSLAAGDFDADVNGDIDLAVLVNGAVKILRNDLLDGQLALSPISELPGGASPMLVRSADLNSDGRDDVVTIAESTGAVAIRDGDRSGTDSINIFLAAPPACPGDISGDRSVNVLDFNLLASNFGAGPGLTRSQGDLTGDGYVNVADFNILAGDLGCGT